MERRHGSGGRRQWRRYLQCVDGSFFDRSNGSFETEKLRKGLGIGDNVFIVGTVAKLRPEKKIDDLVASIARARETGRRVNLVVVGDGPECPTIEGEISKFGLRAHVYMIGEVADVRPALALMDVFVLPSIAVETFSNAALEAMAMCVPVILSDQGGLPEIVMSGSTGLLFPKANINALTDAILSLSMNATQRAVFGAAARTAVEEKFSKQRMLDEYELTLKHSVAGNPS